MEFWYKNLRGFKIEQFKTQKWRSYQLSFKLLLKNKQFLFKEKRAGYF